jgi:hypothetical protein
MDVVRFGWPRLDDFDPTHLAEEHRFHDEAGAKDGYPSYRSCCKLLDERLEDNENRQRRGGDEFPYAEVRSYHRDGGGLRAGSLQPADITG